MFEEGPKQGDTAIAQKTGKASDPVFRPLEHGHLVEKLIAVTVFVSATGIALQSFYTAGFGVWDPLVHRPALLVVATLVVVLTSPLVIKWPDAGNASRVFLWSVDFVLLAVVVLACLRYIAFRDSMSEGIFSLSAYERWIALAAIGSLLELTRRIFGLPLTIFGAGVLGYAIFGQQLPGFLRHAGFSLDKSMETIWYTTSGVFGLPMAIMMQLVLVFIVFGVLLEGTGAGRVLLKIAFHASKKLRGGPAHAAIFSSAMFGTMSGSVVANVVGTGTFTIPMTIKRGFKPHYAGGIEAAASTGGQLMPPIMGAAAFYMAQITAIPYYTIVVAALLPSLFYYLSLILFVEIQARKDDIKPIGADELEPITRVDWLHSLMFIAPVLTIIVVLLMGRSPGLAGFFAIIAVLVSSLLNEENRRNPRRLLSSVTAGGIAAAQIIVAVGALGVIISTLDFTGVGVAFAQFVLEVGNDQLFLSLLATAAGALILGMGMPTLPAYLIIVIILGPAMQKLGLSLMTVHLFVLYYGVLSAVTPPVAIAAYAAAPIANANPLVTSVSAFRLTIVGFLIPFVFVYNPSFLLVEGHFSLWELAFSVVRLAIAIWMLTTAIVGFEGDRLSWLSRFIRLAASGCVLFVDPYAQTLGIALALGVVSFASLRFQRDAGRQDLKRSPKT